MFERHTKELLSHVVGGFIVSIVLLVLTATTDLAEHFCREHGTSPWLCDLMGILTKCEAALGAATFLLISAITAAHTVRRTWKKVFRR